MTSPIINYFSDKDLDDAALWAAIDSAAAASLSSNKPRKPLLLKNSPIPKPTPSPHVHFPKHLKNSPNYPDGEVLQNKPPKFARLNETSPLALAKVKQANRTPTTPVYVSMDSMSNSPRGLECSPGGYERFDDRERNMSMMHCLSGRFPMVDLFKEYQNAAMAILEKSDYTMISGHPFIKKTGWRKISFYFNVSYEIRDKTIEFDDNRNVIRAEFVVRAFMQGGRFSDGWGSCERREKKFSKPNHDIPSTAETRAKNKACQDLLGIGEYRPGASHHAK